MTVAGEGGPGAVRDTGRIGEITGVMLSHAYPQWGVLEQDGTRWATRSLQEWTWPRSLTQRIVVAADLAAVAEKLCLQEYLHGLDPEELVTVHQDVLLPGTT